MTPPFGDLPISVTSCSDRAYADVLRDDVVATCRHRSGVRTGLGVSAPLLGDAISALPTSCAERFVPDILSRLGKQRR